LKEPNLLSQLRAVGLNVIAFSFDSFKQFDQFKDLIAAIGYSGMVTRVTFNVLDRTQESRQDFIDKCNEVGVRQLSFRRIITPIGGTSNYESDEAKQAIKYIIENTRENRYLQLTQSIPDDYHMLRKLPYGVSVYDADGIALTYFDYCLQETHEADDIRSIIFDEDGHVYTSWASRASILF
jgi:hypothetical protein